MMVRELGEKKEKRFLTPFLTLFLTFSLFLLFSSLNVPRAFAAEGDEKADQEEKIDYRPDRVLTKKEREKLQELSKTLITKSKSPDANTRSRSEVHRGWAAQKLGHVHHKDALPALFTVLKDKTDFPGVRVRCIEALKRINDKRVIEVLMDAALDDHYNVANHAQSALYHVLGGKRFFLDSKWSKEKKEKEVQKWRVWWRKNRDKYVRVDNAAWLLSLRKWTNITGKFTVEAYFIELKQGKVRLKKADGETISLLLNKLSKADQE